MKPAADLVTVSADELLSLLAPCCQGPEAVPPLLLDTDYALPSRAWLGGAFARDLFANLNALGLRYESNAWDCDKFARMAAWEGWVSHFKTTGHRGGLALGLWCYVTDTGGAHAINVAIVREAGALVLVHFEPQTQLIVDLTKTEFTNAFLILL